MPLLDRNWAAFRAQVHTAADLYERDMASLIGLCIREAGKTAGNGLSDVREAIGFLLRNQEFEDQLARRTARPVALEETAA